MDNTEPTAMTTFKIPWLSMMLTLALIVIEYFDVNKLLLIACFAVIVTHVIIRIAYLVFTALNKHHRKLVANEIKLTCLVILFPVLMFPSYLFLARSGIPYVAVRIMGPSLIRQIQLSPHKAFKYAEFGFFLPHKDSILVYDESDLIAIDPDIRKKNWWASTGVDTDSKIQGYHVYSHFYILNRSIYE